jgi:glycosyltransferase involved in cell wall biosynthesis
MDAVIMEFSKETTMKNKYTFHLLGLAHLPTSKNYLSCAFTQKNIKLSKMLCDLGHTVYLYGARGTDKLDDYVNSDNFHFVETHTVADIARDYGNGDNRFELGYNWKIQDFKHDMNGERVSSTLKFYAKAIEEINKIKQPDDFLLATQGQYHRPIADGVKLFLTCESGIGYRGTCQEMYRCFESPYIQNFTYGSDHPYESLNGSYYDRVIPNYFDPNDIEFSEKKGDYYLFIGRLIKRKGILTAYEATKAIGAKLIIVGQGGFIDTDGSLRDNDPMEFRIPKDSDWEYRGYADLATRKDLMAHAIATFTPTEYLECFAGTHVESMLSGTPPITTDFAVFPHTIPDHLNGKIGFRCNTLQDFVDASLKAKEYSKNGVQAQYTRGYAERFLMDNVAKLYQKWFDDLHNVWESAVDSSKQGWHRVNSTIL